MNGKTKVAQLQRILMPGAPPRKRRNKRPSPDRQTCEVVDRQICKVVDCVLADEELHVKPASILPIEAASVITEFEVGDDGVAYRSCLVEQQIEIGKDLADSTLRKLNTTESELAKNTKETKTPVDSMSLSPTAPAEVHKMIQQLKPTCSSDDVKDVNWESVTDTLLESDDDIQNTTIDIDDGIPFPTVLTATDQPADDYNLTNTERDLIRREDEVDDRHVRQLVPTDDYFDFKWTSDKDTFTGKREVFTGTSGPTFPVTNHTQPVDIFYKMFDDTFINLLVQETNRYAEQSLAKLRQDPTKNKRNIRALRWTPTDRDEIISFLAFIILQGLYPKVSEESFFLFDGYGTTPYFRCVFTYNRYVLLKKYLHFTDNEDQTTQNTKLNKIKPVLDYLNDKFSTLYMPGQEIAIDESLLKWYGRLSFSQKIATKAAGVGVKTYELCESDSGYLWKFAVYTGKDGPNRPTRTSTDQAMTDATTGDQTTTDQTMTDATTGDQITTDQTMTDNDDEDNERLDDDSGAVRPNNATSKIVFNLVEPLLHKGHTLIMDNFFNSPLLARCLKRNGRTDMYGTLRLAREFVPESIKTITKTDMRQGEVVACYTSDLAVMLWKDANMVGLISTYHRLQIAKTEKNNKTTYKPTIVLDYNKSMGGVDRKDQFLAAQPLERSKNKIWYKKLFRRLFNAGIFNCFVIFTRKNNKIDHRKFRQVLSESLLKIHRHIDLTQEPRLLARQASKPVTVISSATETATSTPSPALTQHHSRQRRPYVVGNHFPAAASSRHSRCRMCAINKKTARTAYKCIECDVPLCIVDCFMLYHKPETV